MTETLAHLFSLTFVGGSMAAVGRGLTIGQIITPLRDGYLVLKVLEGTFILVPDSPT